jgi:L-lysine epsilon oxidase C-terminal domain
VNTAPTARPLPDELDHAALSRCVGGGFNPGIEAGKLMKVSNLYAEPFRFTRGAFADGRITLRAGSITERMALPWQADFMKCGQSWWPAQRPGSVYVTDTNDRADWDRGISKVGPHIDLVKNFWRLGYVHDANPGQNIKRYIEKERDPNFHAAAPVA